MSETKKQRLKRWRLEFNEKCLKRDGGNCVICGQPAVDVHHITDRRLMPNYGFAPENGISLCAEHHKIAEAASMLAFHVAGQSYGEFKPSELYKKIGSSFEIAEEACDKLE
jgi:5-methylcytosine-specific restriction endonuclease McrA